MRSDRAPRLEFCCKPRGGLHGSERCYAPFRLADCKSHQFQRRVPLILPIKSTERVPVEPRRRFSRSTSLVARAQPTGECAADWRVPAEMEEACRYSDRPLAFLARYVRRRPFTHVAILLAVVAAVACSVGAQYGVKVLVDTLAGGLYVGTHARDAWLGFLLLTTLIAADNLLWRVASWIASYTFVAVTGDLRRDLFRHLTGHAPSYFADRMPGTLTSRITATSNAVFTLQNMSVWNVMPPCMATLIAIALVV